MVEDLVRAIADLKEKEALRITQDRLNLREDPYSILDDATSAMEIVGKRFEEGEYFIPDLIFSGAILQKITKMVMPELTSATDRKKLGKFVIGTVAGDIHDIGKNIVTFLLDINSFEVYDLGIDVPAKKFVDKIEEVKPDIVGLSGLLTLTFDSMKETIDTIKAAGLRDRVKIIIGGSQVDDRIREYTGADAYSPDAVSGVRLAKEWVGRG